MDLSIKANSNLVTNSEVVSVSILILMDLSIKEYVIYDMITGQMSFNPYFNGSFY